jgi:DNA-binding IclR family transcriptional regulator
MAESKANSFTTYLEEKQRWEREKQAAPVAAGTAFSILAVLASRGPDAVTLADLQAASGMGFTNFAEAIKRLQEMGYITVTGAPGGESAQLTQLGTDVASLARPA